MKKHLRGVWFEDKVQNLIMILRYNKNNLVVENFEGKDWSLLLDCGIWYVNKWRYNKIGHKGIIDIFFNNGKYVKLIYFGEKYKFSDPLEKPRQFLSMNDLLEKIINEE